MVKPKSNSLDYPKATDVLAPKPPANPQPAGGAPRALANPPPAPAAHKVHKSMSLKYEPSSEPKSLRQPRSLLGDGIGRHRQSCLINRNQRNQEHKDNKKCNSGPNAVEAEKLRVAEQEKERQKRAKVPAPTSSSSLIRSSL